ncbi:hypothetical protein PRK78_005059 [Emydomyces testavorans]|uniref:Protein kinase domain-containing protein n=1 Tax=Emydomyces testavorans TaxID=2070801 RepID=A0AAF0DMN4_9EURO|nr:hypothetical protein PRK78_005059 [Emydomyces testavorans]
MSDYGDFVDRTAFECDLDDYTEPLTKYLPNAQHRFYPICLGEVLNQQYQVEHKLGHGGFSTVWMAYDLKNKTDVALKVMAEGLGEHEYHMQREILKSVKDTSHLITYLNTFILHGNGKDHRVLVYPLHGPHLSMYTTLKRKSMTTRMSAARQLLQALESLHNSGIVHQDLNEGNCMWGMVFLSHLSREAKYSILGRPQKAVIDEEDLWKPGELVQPVEVPENLCTETFYLGDFGLAMKLGTSAAEYGLPPIEFCAPERLFNAPPSIASDMWSYMCLFSELYCGTPPFCSSWMGGGMMVDMVRKLGPLPKQWKGHYYYSNSECDSWFEGKPDPKRDLAATISRLAPHASHQELKHVLSIMYSCFNYHPEKRPTATQLLRDPSFRAIMDIYCP